MSNKKMFNNISTLMIGTLVSQAIPIICSPILTRLYTPEEFGSLALFMSISSVFSVLANFRLDAAIMSADCDKERNILKQISIISTVIFSLVLLSIALFFNEKIVLLFGIPSLGNFIYLIPVFVMLFGMTQLYTYLANSVGDYKAISLSKVNKNFSMTILQLIIGFINKGAMGLIYGVIISFLFAWYSLRKYGTKDKNIKIDYKFNEYKKVLKKYKDFPLFSTGTALLDNIAVESPVILINKFHGNFEVGYFDLVRKTLMGPLSVISTSISQVYLRNIVDKNATVKSKLKDMFLLQSVLIVISIIIGPFIYFVGDDIFAFVFGEDWRIAGEYAKILIFAYLIRFIISPFSVVFLQRDNIKIGAIWQGLYLIITLVVAFINLPQGILDFFIAFTISEVTMYLVYFLLIIYSIINENYKKKSNRE